MISDVNKTVIGMLKRAKKNYDSAPHEHRHGLMMAIGNSFLLAHGCKDFSEDDMDFYKEMVKILSNWDSYFLEKKTTD